jgi:hypothetical protein
MVVATVQELCPLEIEDQQHGWFPMYAHLSTKRIKMIKTDILFRPI